MSFRQRNKRRIRSATIAVAVFATISQIALVDAIAKTSSEQAA
jgi:DNA-binding transcriptional regulator of glucitol operon